MARKNALEMTKEELRREINWVRKDFVNLCIEIAQECEEEGYPSGGTNYDLRCTAAWNSYFEPEIEYLTAVLETGKEPEEDHGEWVKLDLPAEFAEDAED